MSGVSDSCFVDLREIHIDILDYIHPAYCPNAEFRTMWAEFEWENKVAVNTTMQCVSLSVLSLSRSLSLSPPPPPAPKV